MSRNLPTLSTPLYTTTLPVCKKKVTYRPFLVKEEKAILLAKKTAKGPVDMIKTITAVVKACVKTPDNLVIEDLTYVDFRYLMLTIRNQSKGSELGGNMTCKKCDHKTTVVFDFDEVVKVENVPYKIEKKIMLDGQVGFVPKIPTVADIEYLIETANVGDDENIEARIQNNPEAAFLYMGLCMPSLFDAEDIYNLTPDEASAYIQDNFSEKHMTVMADFIKAMPRVVVDLSFECEKCKSHNKVIVEGDRDFFH